MKILILGCGYVGMALAKKLNQEHYILGTTTSKNRCSELLEVCHEALVLKGGDPLPNVDLIVVTAAPQRGGDYSEVYLETAINVSKHPTRIIYTGSTSVYGDANGNWVTEESPLYPENEKGEILVQTENEYLKNPEVTILRLAGIYGPGRGGYFTNNNIHRDDIVSAIEWVLTKDLKGVYNVCQDPQTVIDHPKKRVCNQKIKDTGFLFLHAKSPGS